MNHLSHLSDEQLSALLDDALPARARAECDAHLAGCEACRVRLTEASALDASLGRALAHDPGDAYFADFAERVSARIAAESPAAAASSPGAPKRTAWSWLLSPRGLSLVGSTAALVLVAGLAWMRFRNPDDGARMGILSRSGRAPTATEQAAPPPTDAMQSQPAPASGGSGLDSRATSPTPSEPATPPSAPATGFSRARPSDEEVSARTPAFASPPSPEAAARLEQREKEDAARSLAAQMKRRALAPAQEKATTRDELQKTADGAGAPAPASRDAARFAEPRAQANAMQSLDVTAELDSPCGTVHDTRGSPVAGAQVVALGGETRTARSGADGRFCLGALRTGDTLSVMRVGYEPVRVVVGPATSLAFKLEPVGTLGPQAGGLVVGKPQDAPSRLTEGDDTKLGWTRTTPLVGHRAPVADLYATQPPAIRLAVTQARRTTEQARRERTASSYERAADRWEKVGARIDGKPGWDARFQGIAALREAYRLEPTSARATRLRARLAAFVEMVPETLPERTTALRWMSEL